MGCVEEGNEDEEGEGCREMTRKGIVVSVIEGSCLGETQRSVESPKIVLISCGNHKRHTNHSMPNKHQPLSFSDVTFEIKSGYPSPFFSLSPLPIPLSVRPPSWCSQQHTQPSPKNRPFPRNR